MFLYRETSIRTIFILYLILSRLSIYLKLCHDFLRNAPCGSLIGLGNC